jgi:hypothetical protein
VNIKKGFSARKRRGIGGRNLIRGILRSFGIITFVFFSCLASTYLSVILMINDEDKKFTRFACRICLDGKKNVIKIIIISACNGSESVENALVAQRQNVIGNIDNMK